MTHTYNPLYEDWAMDQRTEKTDSRPIPREIEKKRTDADK